MCDTPVGTHWMNHGPWIILVLRSWYSGVAEGCITLHRGVGEGTTPLPGLLHFTLDTYLKLLSVKQGGIKYHF